MTDLADLYQQVILDHNRNPRNFGPLAGATCQAQGHNPLCGDRVTVFARVSGPTIEEVAFQGSGCAISKAAASMMTTLVKGRSVAEVEALATRFHSMVTSDPNVPVEAADLGKLAAFAGVRAFPTRVKCATLPWHALRAVIRGAGEPVSTE
ncbi:MAG: SUF system NifU family Fe-S cluster assembly protein [Gemmatimonadetes bacterium]|nr:SUF system NifU family Fe-S cluster assembly protein [Gemmatimonadota bacterium]